MLPYGMTGVGAPRRAMNAFARFRGGQGYLAHKKPPGGGGDAGVCVGSAGVCGGGYYRGGPECYIHAGTVTRGQ